VSVSLAKELKYLVGEVHDVECELWDLRHRVALLSRENEQLRSQLKKEK